jgi:N-alpha-acetyltransferase 15/16, NatA auxiliary subunit
VSKLYETRQYKKGSKVADQILKKFPAHGETLSMKGLILNSMGRKAEALELVKQGLKCDLKSPVCWHVFGLVHRSDKNYPEAIKCYRNALRIEPENHQIMRDMAMLQAHVRDVYAHVETRRLLLNSKNIAAMNWLGFAVAHDLAGNTDMAAAIVERYESTLDVNRETTPEDGETTFYQAALMAASGPLAAGGASAPSAASTAAAHKATLAFLKKPGTQRLILDDTGLAEETARLQLSTGDHASAASSFLSLLVSINPDNHGYHASLQAALQQGSGAEAASSSRADALLPLYALLAKKHPRCRTLPWVLLRCLPAAHPAFLPIAAAYVRSALRRGIPALVTELKHAWAPTASSSGLASWADAAGAEAESAAKRTALLALAEEYFAALQDKKPLRTVPFPDAAPPSKWEGAQTLLGACDAASVAALAAAPGDDSAEQPSTFPFAGLLACRLLDSVGRHADSIAVADASIAHSPTVLELYLAKGRCLKHQGNAAAAAECVDHARSLDLADRHLNAKAVKYALGANDVESAERLMALFSRHDTKKPHADPLSSIRDVQVAWFEIACGEALERRGDLGRAIKQYARVEGLFETFREDAFDYHNYCLRRSTLRAYTAMMAWGDTVQSHSYFLRAAAGAARCFLALHRDPALLARLREQAKAAADTATAAATAAAGTAKAAPQGDDDENVAPNDPGIDTDPEGSKLLAPESPLEEAWKHARHAAEALPPAFQTPQRVFEVKECAAVPRALVAALATAPPTAAARYAGIGDLAAAVHSVCADVAGEKKLAGAAAVHALRAAAFATTGARPAGVVGPSSSDPAVQKVVADVAAALAGKA